MRNVLSAVCFLVVMLASSDAFADGWYKTKWGMTKTNAEKAVGCQFNEVSETWATKRINYELKHFDVGGKPCSIKMSFPENRLSFVMVQVEDTEYGDFISFYDMLMGKYGKPSKPKTEEKERRSVTFTAEWITDETIIKLNYVQLFLKDEIYTTVNVQYQPRPLDGADRL